MKPQIAIGLSSAGVEVLHRGRDGWRMIDAVPLDDPDLAGRLRAARARGQDLVKGPFVAKLIIPESEILYRTVHAPGPDDAAREAQIAAAIDGLTPYAIDDLVFDWCGIGDELQVAVVARETLAEAEAFAAEHGLDAAAFVGAPDDARFMGEVYFGRTSMAAWLVPPDETIERDAAPVVSVGPVPAAVPRPILPGGSSPASAAGKGAPESGATAPVQGQADAAAPGAPARPVLPPSATEPADPAGEDVAAAVRAAGQATRTPADASPGLTPRGAPVHTGRSPDAPGNRKPGRAGSGSAGTAGLAGGLASVLPWFARGKAGAAATSTASAALKTATGSARTGAGAIGTGASGVGASGAGAPPAAAAGNGTMPAASVDAAAPDAARGTGTGGDAPSTGESAAPIAFSSRRRPAQALAEGSAAAAKLSDRSGSGAAAPARQSTGSRSGAKTGKSGLRSLGARLEQMRARLTRGDRRRADAGMAAAGSAQTRPDDSAKIPGGAGTSDAGPVAGDADTPPATDATRSDTLSTKARALLKRSGRDRRDGAPTGRTEVGKDKRGNKVTDKGRDAARSKGATAHLAVSPATSKPELKKALAAPVPDLTARDGHKPLTAEAAGTEAEKLTIFGARGKPPAERGFLSRGLVLTGGLVLFLVAVAVWAVYFTSAPDPQTGTLGPAETAPPPVAALPGAEPPADAAGLTDPDALPAFDEQAQIDATISGIEEALAEAAEPVAEPAPAEPAPAPAEDSAGPGPALASELASDPGAPTAPSAAATRDASDALRTEGGGVTDAPFALSSLTPPSGAAAVMPEPPPAPAPFGTEPVPGAASSPDFEPPPEVIEGRPAAVPPPRPAGLVPQDDARAPRPAPDAETAPSTIIEQAAAPAAPAPGAVVDPAPESADAQATGTDRTGTNRTETAAATDAAPAPLTASQADAQGIALFTEADPLLAALRPQARPGAEAATGPAVPAPVAESAAAAPDAAASAPDAMAALATPESAPLARPHEDAEVAARAQGLALFSVADPELAVLRPETRPETVLAAAVARATPTETEPSTDQAPVAEVRAPTPETGGDSAVTASPGGLVLTALRPAARPESLIARPAERAAAPDDATPEVTSDSPYAVAQSLRPSQRPQDFSRRVQQTMAAVQQRQQQAPAAAQQAAPVQQASAPARTATPQIPTSASVAREATQARAINLRQLNLLGTFGTRSNRTALVRLSNGRVQQVRVGDPLDRGQVTAIGESELTYVRSGRTVRLRVGERG